MKKFIFASTVVLGLAASLRADTTNSNVLVDEKARVSYAIGLSVGHNFLAKDLDLDPDVVGRAIKDVLTGRPELLSRDQVGEVLKAFQAEYQVKMRAKQTEVAAKNKAEGAAFLAKNKTAPGVQTQEVTLPDNTVHEFQYIVESTGTGAKPATTDMVKVNYRGTFLDGTEFDSSYKRGQPASFRLNQVIPGWTESLSRMTVGSKWKIFLPSDLAYGDQGNRGIPGGSLLVFEVELLDTTSAASMPHPGMAPSAPLTSDIIKVPSAEDMKKGAKIEVIKPQDAPKAQN